MLETNKNYFDDAKNILSLLPDNSVNLIITDPPYEINGHGGMNSFIQTRKYETENFEEIIKGYDYDLLNEFKRVSLQGYIFCSEKQISKTLEYFQEPFITNILVWHKVNAPPFSNGMWRSDLEYIIHYRKRKEYFVGGYSVKSKLISHPIISNSIHPAEKPIKIIEKFLEISSKPNDIILDPFSGSGTTAIACIRNNRKYIICENKKEYYDLQTKRILEEIDKTSLFNESLGGRQSLLSA